MLTITKINTESLEYAFVENLMRTAFPSDERREDACQRFNVDKNERMQCLLIKDGDENVGFFTVWSLASGFSYVEHFAISEDLRHCGYGTKALAALVSEIKLNKLILEVEMPSTEESIRRISFYERSKFVLWPKPYIQPPYSPNKQSLPMRIMTLGDVTDSSIESAIEEIYRVVYNQ